MRTRLAIRVTRRAAREIRRASAWWAKNRADAPNAVGEDVEQAFAILAVQPGIGGQALNQKLAGVRRFRLGRIRYHLYYRVALSTGELHVLALWHTSRGTRPRL